MLAFDPMNAGALSIVLAAAIFGTAGLFVKTIPLSSTSIACFRLLVPAVILLALRPELRVGLFTRPDKHLLIASALTALRILLWVVGFLLAPMSKAVVVLYTWPLFLTLFSVVFLKERVTRRNLVLLLVAFSGIVLFCSQESLLGDRAHIYGMACMFMVAILNATVLTVFKGKLRKHEPEEILLYDNSIGALIFLPFLLADVPNLNLQSLLFGTVYGFLIGFAGYYLLYFGLSRVKASVASILSYTEVVTAGLLGVVVFSETLSLRMVAGALLILIPATLVRKE